MFRQLDFRSFFTFLGRNRLYTAINLFGLSVSLMFVILIADYTVRQFTVDNFHAKAGRIGIVGSENALTSGYYLQKYLLDRYPEIEATCAVTVGGWNTSASERVEAGQQQANARPLFADSTFFRLFDYELVAGDRRQALAARDNVVLSESFARQLFGPLNPLGQTLRLPDSEETLTVSAVVRDFDRTVLPECDMILRGELVTRRNPSIDERMSNAGSSITFVLLREGADLAPKLSAMAEDFKSFYWLYKGNVCQQVTFTPLREVYFSPVGQRALLRCGSRSFVMILFGVGIVILAFAVMNYINLTVAQSGFRAKEMASRRLLGASQGEIVAKMVLESTLLCAAAFLVALTLAEAAAPYAAELVEARIAVWSDITPAVALCYAAGVAMLGLMAGIVPALTVSRFRPIDIVRGALRYRTKRVYSRVLIAVQNIITVALLSSSLAIWLQIRHLIDAPLGYQTADILNIDAPYLRSYANIRRFRDELRRLPSVESVALSQGTPHNGGNNNTIQYGPDRMISFQTLIADSVFFRMLGLERIVDHGVPNAWLFNEQAMRELEIPADATHVKMGLDYSDSYAIGGVVRDFQLRSVLDGPTAVRLFDVGDFDRWWQPDEQGEMHFTGNWPWDILVKTRGDRHAAYQAIERLYHEIAPEADFIASYLEQQIEEDFREQRRMLRIVGLFTAVALLISALGLVAMSTYYIRQKEQEVAVRKVFGSTRGEVLRRLIASFMRLVAVAFLIACPLAWWGLDRWLEDYSVRIALSPLIFLAAGLFAALVALAAVFWQSDRAARANPIDAIKN